MHYRIEDKTSHLNNSCRNFEVYITHRKIFLKMLQIIRHTDRVNSNIFDPVAFCTNMHIDEGGKALPSCISIESDGYNKFKTQKQPNGRSN